MSVLKKLYREVGNGWLFLEERELQDSLSFVIDFGTPGTYTFSFTTNVPINGNGDLPRKYFVVKVNGIERFRARGAYAWRSHTIFVDQGPQRITFQLEGFGNGDSCRMRDAYYNPYLEMKTIDTIEQTKFPKNLDALKTYSVIQGSPRWQSTGNKGCEVEFTLLFSNIKNWRDFMSHLYTPFIIKGDYGVYGGIIPPNEVDTLRKGTLIMSKCKLISQSRAGIGVDGT
ncbi:hypothetical protein [Bacillus sp. PGP15]|uniref:hypothetical protein n=1 Tax=Bacillus TaxID=1386 RepID=UPI0020010FA4|nr:hypothetical protein [Bacillus sp. PGP15]UPL46405.1 hypothetical protein MU858_10815 [Bacillus sp. PGP15]